jgi:Rieske 2Fe-2S family protein
MTDPRTSLAPELAALLATRQAGHGMPREFYQTEALYAAEMHRLWQGGWLFAGFAIELPNPGDYITFAVDRAPVLVLRGDDGRVRAFHNVCRHRGSQLCRAASGHVRSIVCPYHAWTYARSGELRSANGMDGGRDKSQLGLAPLHVAEVAGLIYVCLAAEPPDIEGLRSEFSAMAAPQGFERARIAHVIDYEVEANWKLVWENNRECLHCVPCHPQYVKSNFDVVDEQTASPAMQQKILAATARIDAKWLQPNPNVAHAQVGLATFPDPERGRWFTSNRSLLAEGFVTESMDGKRVAPLMGDYDSENVGVLRMRSLPNFWLHASCDHAVAARMLPAGPRKTVMRGYWLVDAKAKEGEDYQLDRLLPFWNLTNEQDWNICKWQQKGVDSIGYVPGPLSSRTEYNVDAFIRWYLGQMSASANNLAVPCP